MKKKLILLLVLFGILLGGCNQNKAQTNKVDLKTGDKLSIKQLSSWDRGILQSVINYNNTGLCNNVKHITLNECEHLYTQQKLYLQNLECDKVVFQKQLCLDKLNLKKENCDKIVNKSIKVQCVYEKNLQQALKNNNKDFCKTLPRNLKLDCEKKFNIYGQK